MKLTSFVLPAALAAVVVLVLGYIGLQQYSLYQTHFLEQHWQKPLAPQGLPPAHFTELEASLSPDACGQCHQQQYTDWQQSLHSKTMTAGLLWQLRLMPQNDANKCLDCHAPLAEQKALVAIEQNWPSAPSGALPSYVSEDLAQQGLVCAACHVRKHQRFGPEPLPTTELIGGEAHNGFSIQPEFSQSEFCAGCHQFPEDGSRTAGKLRENTYQEWLASPYADQGVQCQSCHMPDRKHKWQGIHSPNMVEQAVSTELSQQGNHLTAKVTNSGAGHLFPTYMVPKVNVQLVLVTADGEQLLQEKVIGWQVSEDLLTEEFDTRLAPNESVELSYQFDSKQFDNKQFENKPIAGKVELRLAVAPAEHYERNYTTSLGYADKLDKTTLDLLKTAYKNAKYTRYTLNIRTIELK